MFGNPATGGEALPYATVGDLKLPYDGTKWALKNDNGQIRIDIQASPHDRYGIGVEITKDSEGQCTPQHMIARSELSYEHAWERHFATIRRPGFDLHVATLDMGCRNWTGSPVFACTVYRGKTYFFTADLGGCVTPPNYDGQILEMLSGLEPKV